jgi:hypothetical protein
MSDEDVVGETEADKAIFAMAAQQITEWIPWEFENPPRASQNWWSIFSSGALMEIDPKDERFPRPYKLTVGYGPKKQEIEMSLAELKAAAISFLVFTANQIRKETT